MGGWSHPTTAPSLYGHELKSYIELSFMTLKSDAKFEEKLACSLENDIRNLANFHRSKNSNFILESKMVELNQNKNSKEPYRSDGVWKRYFTLEKNEYHN